MTMRAMTVSATALLATLLLAAEARAYGVDFTGVDTSVGTYWWVGSGWDVGDTIALTVSLNTEDQGDIMRLAFGIRFDERVFEYLPAASSTPTYVLYTSSKNPYLAPASSCSPVCDLFPEPPANQVQIEFEAVGWNSATSGPQAGNGELGTYVFRMIDAGPWQAWQFDFVFSPDRGGALLLSDDSTPPLRLGPPVGWYAPEPATALMLGLGRAGLCFARQRRR